MKKLISLILVIIFTINTYVFADDEIEEINNEQEIIDILQTSSTVEDTIKINSRAAVVIERTTHTILYGKNETQQRPMASTTKIMTRNSST